MKNRYINWYRRSILSFCNGKMYTHPHTLCQNGVEFSSDI